MLASGGRPESGRAAKTFDIGRSVYWLLPVGDSVWAPGNARSDVVVIPIEPTT